MNFMEEENVQCPYCGEPIVLLVDTSSGSQQYVEDCHVCCQPILVSLDVVDNEMVGIEVERENG